METAAAAMLEAGVGRFSRAPAMAAALLAEMWAPLATLPSLLRRLQLIVLRIRSRGKEVIQSHIVGTYYSSSSGEDDDEDDVDDESSDDDDGTASCSSGDDEKQEDLRRIGFYEADGAGGFPWSGAVVRTWQGLPRRFSGCVSASSGGGAALSGAANGPAAVRLWGASTASGTEPWWTTTLGADGGDGARSGEAPSGDHAAVVVGWNGGAGGVLPRPPSDGRDGTERHRRRGI